MHEYYIRYEKNKEIFCAVVIAKDKACATQLLNLSNDIACAAFIFWIGAMKPDSRARIVMQGDHNARSN